MMGQRLGHDHPGQGVRQDDKYAVPLGLVCAGVDMYTDFTPILLERLELLASFEIADLDIANFRAICDGLYPTEFSFSNPTITYAGNPFPVDVAHSLAAHNNGTVNGSSN
jgi:hypothetical protein